MAELPGRMVLVCERHALRRLQLDGAPRPSCPACERGVSRGRTASGTLMRKRRPASADEKFGALVEQEERERWW